MPPLTQGLTSQQSQNEKQAQAKRFGLATSATPAQVAAPTFNLQMPDEIPSTTLAGNNTFADVMTARSRAEQNQMNSQALGGQYDQLMGRIQTPVGATPFRNPEAFINDLLLNRPTNTQNQLDQARTAQAGAIRGFAGDYAKAGDQAREELGVGNLQAELGNTRNRIAERTVKLREDLRNFEVNAEQRAVAREYVVGAKQKLQADAATELADLSIIEAAQTGNLQMAQQEVDRVLNEKLQSFEFENQAIQAEIKRLEAMDTREADSRKTQLEIALQERSRNIEQALADEREKRSYMIDAAQNGADQGTLDAIRNATTAGEAALLAGPWTGRLDRQAKLANIAQSYASAAASNTSRLLSLAEAGDPDAISKLKFDPRSVKEELDPTTKRGLEEKVSSTSSLLTLAAEYKDIIDNEGYTNQVFGDSATLGRISSLRGLITAEYKRAESLGTLDAGLLKLMDSILGEEPTSSIVGYGPEGNIFTNATGRKSAKLSAQLGEFVDSLTTQRAQDQLRLGINPTVLAPDDEAEIDAGFGTTNTSTPSFDPSSFYKK